MLRNRCYKSTALYAFYNSRKDGADMREYFPALYGNEAVKARLGASIESSTLPHAFLIIGAEGSGKKTLALELAAALNCENKNNSVHSLPCGRCNTCRRIKEGNFTDITSLKRSGDKATLGVEEVRLFREDMFLSPTESNFKLYVIEEADRLTPNAQNALLTVLEEPPKNVIILLLSESGDKILTTIKSRAQTIAMQRFCADVMRDYVIRRSDKAALYAKTSPEVLDGILMSADGRIGRALTLLSDKEAKEMSADRALTERIINAIRYSAPYSEFHSVLSELPTSRAEFCEALESLICAVRDITLLRLAPEIPLLFYTDRQNAISISSEINTKKLIAIYEIFKDALEDATKNVGIAAVTAELGARIKLI